MADLASIQFKRIITTKVRPTAAQLLEGELAINLADGRIYTKDNSNIVKSLSDFAHGGVITNNFPYDNILSPGFYYDTNLAVSVGKPSTEVTGTGYLLVFNTMDTANESNVVVSNPGSVTTQMFIGGLSGYVWTRTKPTLAGAWTEWSRPIYNGDPVNLKDTITLEATNAANGSSLIFKNAANTTIGYIKYVEATGLMFNAGVHTMTLNKTNGNLVVPGAVFEGTDRVYSPNNIPTTDVIWAEAKLANVNANLVTPGQWKVPTGTLTNYPTLYTGNSSRDGFIECIKTATGLIQNYLSTAENVWYTRTSTNGTTWSTWTRLINIDTTELTKLTQISSSGLNVTGSITTPVVNATVSVNTSKFSSDTVFGFYTIASAAQSINTGGVLVSNSYSDASKVPTNGIYSKGNILTTGTVTAPTFIGALTGNADSATRLQTARNFQWTGDATGLLSFNGTANVSTALTLVDTGVSAGTYQSVTVDTKGRVTAANTVVTGLITSSSTANTSSVATGNTNTYLNVVENTGGTLTSTGASIQVTGAGTITVTSDVAGKLTITGSQTITGNAATATKLQTARTINGVAFDGTSNINVDAYWNPSLTTNMLTSTATSEANKSGMYAHGIYGGVAKGYPFEYGNRLQIHGSGAAVTELFMEWVGSSAGRLFYRSRGDLGTHDWSVVRQIAFTNDNVASATKLQTARTLSWAGDATGSLSFDGTVNVSATLTLANTGVTAGTYKSVTVDTKGRVTGGNDVITGLITSTSATGVDNIATGNTNTFLNITEKTGTNTSTVGSSSQITGAGTVTVASDAAGKITITGSQTITGNAATATKLQTARTINGVSFDGTSNITIADNTKLPLTGGTIDGSITTTNLNVLSGLISSDDNNHYIDIGKRSVNRMNFGSFDGIFNFYNTNKGTGTESTIGVSIVNDKVKATTFEGALNGNAATATKLQTARTINGVSFDGTSNITIADNTKLPLTGGTIDGSLNVSDTITITGVGDQADAFKKLIQASTTTDGGYLAVGNNAADKGYVEIGAIDDADAEIYATQRSSPGNGNTVIRRAKLLDTGGNTSFPGTVTAPTFNGALSGNAASATKLQTARTLSWTGDTTGSLSFDGTSNVSAALTLANSGVTAGTYKSVTVDAKGRVTAGTDVITGLITSTTASGITNVATTNTNTFLNITEKTGSSVSTVGSSSQITGAGTVTVASDAAGKITITGSQTITGNAGSATILETARTLSWTGDATGSLSFNGSTNVSAALTLANSGVTAGTYGDSINVPRFTVDAKGRVTSVVATALRTATTGQTGIVQLNDTLTSTSTVLALTANQGRVLKTEIDTKASKEELNFDNIRYLRFTTTSSTTNDIYRIVFSSSFDGNFVLSGGIYNNSTYNGKIVLSGSVNTHGNGIYHAPIQCTEAIGNITKYFYIEPVIYWDSSINKAYLLIHKKSTNGNAVLTIDFQVSVSNTSNDINNIVFEDYTASGILNTGTNEIDISTTGNATTASSLATARTLSWTGDATGSLSFNGSANVSAALTLSNSGVTAGTYKSVTVDAKGRVTTGNDVITGLITSTSATGVSNVATTNTNTFLNITEKIGSAVSTVGSSSQITGAGTVTVASDTAGKITITGSQTITGNAGSATKLATARTIGGVSFDGTSNINLPGVNTTGNQDTTGTADRAISITNQGRVTALDALAVPPSGLTLVQGYSNGYPYTYGNSIRLGGAGHGEIFVGWSGSDGGLAPSYIRSKRDTSTANWSAWREITFHDQLSNVTVGSATRLETDRTINGTSFDGTSNITTANWGTARTLTVGNTGKSVNGSANISWSLAEIGALPTAGGTITGSLDFTSDNIALRFSRNLDIGFVKQSGTYGKMIVGNANSFEIVQSTESVIPATILGSTTQIFPVLLTLTTAGVLSTKGGFNGNITGNATTASSLATARTFSWTGDATGSLSFNGSANVSTALTLANSGVTAGTYKSVTVDAKGRVTAGNDVITGLITSTSATGTTNVATTNTNTFLNITEKTGTAVSTVGSSSQITGDGTVTVTSDAAGKITITGSQTITGNAATATKLATARTINGVNFDGTANITITDNTKLPLSGGTLTGGLTAPNLTATGSINATTCGVTGMGNYSPSGQGAYLSWNRNNGGGRTDFINHKGGGGGGFDWWNGNENSYTQVMTLDQSGVLSTIGGFNGNATTATSLQTARTINGVSFNGTANITITDNTKLPLSGGTMTGRLISPSILINKVSNVASGISWYSSSYTSWQDYMAQASTTGNGALGNLTAPLGVLVTSWGRRSVIEPSVGFGWTFETVTASGTTPTIVAEISRTGESRWSGAMAIAPASGTASLTLGSTAGTNTTHIDFMPAANTYIDARIQATGGSAANFGGTLTFSAASSVFSGTVTTSSTVSAGSLSVTGNATVNGALTVTRFSSALDFSFLNGGAAQRILSGGLLASNAYADATKVPTYGIYSKGSILTDGTLTSTTGSLTLGSTGGTNSTYIDFFPSSTDTVDARIQATGGSTAAYDGNLTLYAATSTVTGNLNVDGTITVTNVGDQVNAFKKLIQASTTTDGGYLAVGNNAADRGYVELGTTDDADAEIYATQRNGANTVIRRAKLLDGAGNTSFPGTVTAPTFSGALTGNATTASSLATARTFSWTGDATGSLSFNGSANVSAALTLANSGVAAGTYKSVTVDAKGRVTAGTNVVTGLITSTTAAGTANVATSNTNTFLNIIETVGTTPSTTGSSSQITGAGTVTVTSDTAGKITITGSQTITGNAATATKLQTARTINDVSFDGTSNIEVPTLGYNQSWQNVTRSLGTTYTNSTGRPIQISIFASGSSGGSVLSLIIDDIELLRTNQSASMHVTAVIPNGSSYTVTATTLSSWKELR